MAYDINELPNWKPQNKTAREMFIIIGEGQIKSSQALTNYFESISRMGNEKIVTNNFPIEKHTKADSRVLANNVCIFILEFEQGC